MNSKLKAGLLTAGFGAICITVGLGIQYVARFLTPEQFVIGLAVAGISLCFYTMYTVLLARIQYEDQLKSMVDRK